MLIAVIIVVIGSVAIVRFCDLIKRKFAERRKSNECSIYHLPLKGLSKSFKKIFRDHYDIQNKEDVRKDIARYAERLEDKDLYRQIFERHNASDIINNILPYIRALDLFGTITHEYPSSKFPKIPENCKIQVKWYKERLLIDKELIALYEEDHSKPSYEFENAYYITSLILEYLIGEHFSR